VRPSPWHACRVPPSLLRRGKLSGETVEQLRVRFHRVANNHASIKSERRILMSSLAVHAEPGEGEAWAEGDQQQPQQPRGQRKRSSLACQISMDPKEVRGGFDMPRVGAGCRKRGNDRGGGGLLGDRTKVGASHQGWCGREGPRGGGHGVPRGHPEHQLQPIGGAHFVRAASAAPMCCRSPVLRVLGCMRVALHGAALAGA
jgi:hypothetical protein